MKYSRHEPIGPAGIRLLGQGHRKGSVPDLPLFHGNFTGISWTRSSRLAAFLLQPFHASGNFAETGIVTHFAHGLSSGHSSTDPRTGFCWRG